MTEDRLFVVRGLILAATGLICALYSVMALITARPDPIPFWIPGFATALSFFLIWLATAAAGPQATEQAFDEGYLADERRAQSVGFWTAVALYPLFGLMLWLGWVSYAVTFAAMGTLMAAVYLLCVVWFDVRGRA